jgi:hypothetical protein
MATSEATVTSGERAVGWYWIARAVGHPDETFSWNVELANWSGTDWADDSGPDYCWSDSDLIRVLSGPLEAPAPPPPEPMWEPHLSTRRWQLVYTRERRAGAGDAEASLVADREVPEHQHP